MLVFVSRQAAEQLRQAQTELASLVHSERTGAQVEAEARARFRSESTAADAYTGAWPYNRPCAQQYVGKSQSCMVISGRLIVHAPVGGALSEECRLSAASALVAIEGVGSSSGLATGEPQPQAAARGEGGSHHIMISYNWSVQKTVQ